MKWKARIQAVQQEAINDKTEWKDLQGQFEQLYEKITTKKKMARKGELYQLEFKK